MAQEKTIQSIIHQFEHLELSNVQELLDIYAHDAFFKDPFNEVRGHAAIEKIFTHMFNQVDQPRFAILNHIYQNNSLCLTWQFLFSFKNQKSQQVIRGCSWLTLNHEGLITEHRDYWDAAEELYEKLPVLGSLMRWIKRKLKA